MTRGTDKHIFMNLKFQKRNALLSRGLYSWFALRHFFII